MAVARSSSLDALRGIAALSVFGFHAWLYTLPVVQADRRHGLAAAVLHELRLGLVLFFVLSGFLLYAPWARGERPALGGYLRRRAARILPAYYVALLGSVVLLWPLAGAPGVRLPPAGALALFAVFGQDFSLATVMRLDPPMWTLAVEVCFYLALPALGALALRAGRRAVPLALLAAGVAFNAWLSITGRGMPYDKTLPAMAPYFACGMLAAVGRPRRGAVAAGAGLVLADALWHGLADAGAVPADATALLRDLPAAAGFALLVGAAPARLGARPLAAFGVVSYGFYLWHVPVLVWLRAHGALPLDPLGAAAVAGPVALALAVASWLVVERPAIRIGRRPSREVPRHVPDGRIRALR